MNRSPIPAFGLSRRPKNSGHATRPEPRRDNRADTPPTTRNVPDPSDSSVHPDRESPVDGPTHAPVRCGFSGRRRTRRRYGPSPARKNPDQARSGESGCPSNSRRHVQTAPSPRHTPSTAIPARYPPALQAALRFAAYGLPRQERPDRLVSTLPVRFARQNRLPASHSRRHRNETNLPGRHRNALRPTDSATASFYQPRSDRLNRPFHPA